MDPRQVPFSQVGRAFSRSHAYQRTILIGGSRLIPGANPSSSSGSSTSAPDGNMLTSGTSGMPAPWFTVTTQILGILALTAAAVLNVLLFRALAARRRRSPAATPSDAAIGPPPS